MMFSRTICLVIALGMAAGTAPAQGDADPAVQYAAQAEQARAAAQRLKDEYDGLVASAWEIEAVAKDDLAQAGAVYDGIAARYQQAADAWLRGDVAEAQALQSQADKSQADKDVWRQRISEIRRAQFDAMPTEQWHADLARITRPGALEAFNRCVAARKAAAEAWRDLAEATVPGADPEALNEMKEKAFTARSEAEIALWEFHWANQIESLWGEDPVVSAADVPEPLAVLRKLQQERADLKRKETEIERRERELNAEMRAAHEALVRAVWDARKAKMREAKAVAQP